MLYVVHKFEAAVMLTGFGKARKGLGTHGERLKIQRMSEFQSEYGLLKRKTTPSVKAHNGTKIANYPLFWNSSKVPSS